MGAAACRWLPRSSAAQGLWAGLLNAYAHDISGSGDEISSDPLIRLQCKETDDLAFYVSHT